CRPCNARDIGSLSSPPREHPITTYQGFLSKGPAARRRPTAAREAYSRTLSVRPREPTKQMAFFSGLLARAELARADLHRLHVKLMLEPVEDLVADLTPIAQSDHAPALCVDG